MADYLNDGHNISADYSGNIAREIPLEEAGWLGNIWWQNVPSKQVTCIVCGRQENVPFAWPSTRTCSTCKEEQEHAR